MPKTRREFLSETALAAAVVGLGPGLLRDLRPLRSAPSATSASSVQTAYRDMAVRCATWIDRHGVDRSGGRAWPADPLKPTFNLDYYNGVPGVVCFLANLYQATGDPKWRDLARSGGEFLAAETLRVGDGMSAGLYTGLAGIAATYMTLDAAKVGSTWGASARAAAKDLARRAKSVGDGVEWSESNDIISGTAGIGLFLIDASVKFNDPSLADVAAKAGRRLLQMAQPADGGLMWFPGGVKGANYPNFSHGTSGVSYFLATLYQRTKDRAFLDAALAGAEYLDVVATRKNGARAIFHVTGGGENRFYLSWCHGPAGTARLFYRLHQITNDARWRDWIQELTQWIVDSGAPEQQSAGYWNNISQCCGNVGIGQYWLDLSRARLNLRTPDLGTLRQRVVVNTLSRATDDETGLRWKQAENRVSPDNLVAQTGFMQGAAGVGTFFLQLDAFARGQKWTTAWPDTPWG